MNLSFSTHPAYVDPAANAPAANEAGASSAGIGNALTQLREGFTDRIRHYASKVANVQLLDPAPERRECQHAIAKGMIGTSARVLSFVVPFMDLNAAKYESEEEINREWLRVDFALSVAVSGLFNTLAQIDHYRKHPDANAQEISGITWMNWLAEKYGASEPARKRLDSFEHIAASTTSFGLVVASQIHPHDTTKQRSEAAEHFDRDLGITAAAAGLASSTGGHLYEYGRNLMTVLPEWVGEIKQRLCGAGLTAPTMQDDVEANAETPLTGNASGDVSIDIDGVEPGTHSALTAKTAV
ncbi:hypothetical protein AT302_16915 [Pandoraea norimbergensis]|uniref:Uncharacterized protein n=2 Tax=Pandoraea norimbergensis TaxID=93219 RepID=A0ABN4JK20_9BURK|nr:hypothetical protein AT302_16915 [Pandoraea norimbergensis]